MTGVSFSARDELKLALERPPEGEAVVHGAHQTYPTTVLPFDTGTYMPPLCFYGQPIEG